MKITLAELLSNPIQMEGKDFLIKQDREGTVVFYHEKFGTIGIVCRKDALQAILDKGIELALES